MTYPDGEFRAVLADPHNGRRWTGRWRDYGEALDQAERWAVRHDLREVLIEWRTPSGPVVVARLVKRTDLDAELAELLGEEAGP